MRIGHHLCEFEKVRVKPAELTSMARLKDFFQRRSPEEVNELMETKDYAEKMIWVVVLAGCLFGALVYALLNLFLRWESI